MTKQERWFREEIDGIRSRLEAAIQAGQNRNDGFDEDHKETRKMVIAIGVALCVFVLLPWLFTWVPRIGKSIFCSDYRLNQDTVSVRLHRLESDVARATQLAESGYTYRSYSTYGNVCQGDCPKPWWYWGGSDWVKYTGGTIESNTIVTEWNGTRYLSIKRTGCRPEACYGSKDSCYELYTKGSK